MDSAQLDELERLAKRGDPLPWKLNLHMGKVVRYTEHGNERFIADCLRVTKRDAHCKRNAAYIVAACNSLPALIAELKAARAENGELKRHSEWLERKLQIRIDNNAELIKRIEELEKQKEWMVRQLEGYSCFYTAEDFMERAKKEANA